MPYNLKTFFRESSCNVPHTLPPPNRSRPASCRLAVDGIAAICITRSIARALAQLTSDARAAGSRDLVAALDPAGPDAPLRLQTTITSGQKADFGVMLLDPDPLKIDRVHQRIDGGQTGAGDRPAVVVCFDDRDQRVCAVARAIWRAARGRGNGREQRGI